MKRLKAFYTIGDLATLVGVSRPTMRRWLDAGHIPYELRRRPGATRGGRIVVFLSEIRMRAPHIFATLQDDVNSSLKRAA